MLTVSAIGSCRVFAPLKLLAGRSIATDHEGAEWYTHSTRDALQKLKIVRGQLGLDPAVRPLVVEAHELKWRPELHRRDFYGRADLFVVEVCSRKVISRDGVYFQQWPVNAVDKAPEKAPKLAAILAGAVRRRQSEDEVLADLKLLCDRLGKPVLLVPHLTLDGDDGQPILERKTILRTLQRFVATDRRARVFDPTPLVRLRGIRESLIDSGHYQEGFLPDLAEAMLLAITALAEGRPAPKRAPGFEQGGLLKGASSWLAGWGGVRSGA